MPKGGTENKKTKKQKNKKTIKRFKLSGIYCIGLAFFVLGMLVFPAVGQAAVAGYTAEKVAQSYGSLTLPPGKAITFEVSFKNTGKVNWYNNSSNYISLYADGIGKMFRHQYWHTVEQPAKMLETKVAPGGTAHFRFALRAPKLLGFFTIKLKLAAENLTWIPGGILEIPVNVTNTSSAAQTQTTSNAVVAVAKNNFEARKMIQSHEAITLDGGSKVNFIVGFKNIGANSWEVSGANAVKICVSETTAVEPFRDTNWLSVNCPAMVSGATLPGQIGYFKISLVGNSSGDFNPNFVLMNNGKAIAGGEVILPIKISGTVETPIIPSPEPVLGSEPTIRIGLYSTTEQVALRANTSFEVRDSEKNLIFVVPPGVTIYASYNFETKQYAVNLNGELRSNLSYLKFISSDPNTIFEITNYENRPSWNTSLNDNKFRGNLELRYSEGREKLYVINELPMEVYLNGLAESSNNNPIEYHKALAVAARTYAQYNINIGGKHPAGYFHLNASSYDQVYRGYNSEIRLPNFVRAVAETRGMVVTYNGEVVVTPYFSQSDGRTRAWEEVWSAPGKPWLVSKPDPYCAGMNLFGHGVGLSARGARGMALTGNTFEQILKHYYTGVEVKKIY